MEQVAGSPSPSPRYPAEYAARLVTRILLGVLPPGAGWSVRAEAQDGESWVLLYSKELELSEMLRSSDGRFSPDAVRATAARLLRNANFSAAAVQALYYPLPADGLEEEEV